MKVKILEVERISDLKAGIRSAHFIGAGPTTAGGFDREIVIIRSRGKYHNRVAIITWGLNLTKPVLSKNGLYAHLKGSKFFEHILEVAW